MKSILFLFLSLFSLSFVAQNDSLMSYQKENFIKANQALKDSNGLKALYYYHQVCILDLKTDIEVIAKVKIDSLLPIFKKMESQKWKGVWHLKQLKTDRFNYHKIIVTDDDISFYKYENDSIATRIEKILFEDYDTSELTINLGSIKFNNNEIWEFHTEKVGDEIRLFPNLKKDSDGYIYMMLDGRGMIKNNDERDKALAQEIRTYYIKI